VKHREKYFKQCCLAYLRSDVASVMTARSRNVDLTVKWHIKLSSVLYAEVPFHRICDHCAVGFSKEVS
jgi:nitrate reductase gamma subunit